MQHIRPLILTTLVFVGSEACSQDQDSLEIFPRSISLSASNPAQHIVVVRQQSGIHTDITGEVEFVTEPPGVATVDAEGIIRPIAKGNCNLVAKIGDEQAESEITVEGFQSRPPRFELDVVPILVAAGCSTGPCHGKQRGQNGFQLSLLGFDPDFDYEAIVFEGRGRRVFPAAPHSSLLLQKPAAVVPHGGGKRFGLDSDYYRTFLSWVESGMQRVSDSDPTLERISVFPQERVLSANSKHRVIVTAHYSDGSVQDVTKLTAFQSNEAAIANISASGEILSGALPGETTLMARFMNHIGTVGVLIPRTKKIDSSFYAELPANNFIDELVWQKLQRLNITPSRPAPESTLLRRAYLDVIGRPPTAGEVRSFLADSDPNKYPKIVDWLLEQPEYIDHWATKWMDLLRPNPYRVGIKAVWNLDNWVRESFRQQWSYDRFVRELLTAQGSTWRNGAVTVFRDRRTPDEIGPMVSQLFLGIRIECAKCHHHPFETWGQENFFRFAAFFAGMGRKGGGISPPISGSEEMFYAKGTGTVAHPKTGQRLEARPLFGQAPELKPDEDSRKNLVDWMVGDGKEYFSKVQVNRVWADLMGRGLVEPVDDIRATNPPSNPALLDRLAGYFRDSQYDQKQLLKLILSSQVYGLSSEPTPENRSDTVNYSRHYRRRLSAETLLDAVSQITEVPDSFPATAPGTKANQIWTHRVSSIFLDTFGRPDPNQDPPCERTLETTVVQALHLMNSPQLHAKVKSDQGVAVRLSKSEMDIDQIIDELYLSIYARYPEPAEKEVCQSEFKKAPKDRRRVIEDLLWTLINTPEFVFKD